MKNIPEKPLVATGASPVSVSDTQFAVLNDDPVALAQALIECKNYKGWSQFAKVRDELAVTNEIRDEQAGEITRLRAEREVAEERITALDIQLRDADHRIAMLGSDLRSDTAADTVKKLAQRLESADDLNEQHRIEYGKLADENTTLRKLVKDFQRVVRIAASTLDSAAADHDPSQWLDERENFYSWDHE